MLSQLGHEGQLSFFTNVIQLRKMVSIQPTDHKAVQNALKDLACLDIFPDIQVLEKLKEKDAKVKGYFLSHILVTN